MKTAYITSEYNPFHLGHKYQIDTLKKEHSVTHVIACMSGNFMQRGTPALFDKYTRAKLALSCGVDLVLELPVVFAVSSAEFFSFGAMSIASKLSNIDIVSFGSEVGSIEPLLNVSNTLINNKEIVSKSIDELLKSGLSYPTAREKVLSKVLGDEAQKVLKDPNNILGIEYLKNQTLLGFNPINVTIKRKGASYHQDSLNEGELPSATFIRKFINETKKNNCEYSMIEHKLKDFISYNILSNFSDLLKSYDIPDERKYLELLYYSLITRKNDFAYIPESKNGIADKIINSMELLKKLNLEDFIKHIKSKNDTYSRINRAICQFILGFNSDYKRLRTTSPSYVKILAMNERGREYISSIRKTSEIKLIHSFKNIEDDILKYDMKASEVYSLLTSSYDSKSDFYTNIK